MDKFIYIPENVCSTRMEFYIENEIIVSMKILRGCAGNTQGVSRLSEGQNINFIEQKLCGIKCPNSKDKQTSCPDQVSKALSLYKMIKHDSKLKEKYKSLGYIEENIVLEASKQKMIKKI